VPALRPDHATSRSQHRSHAAAEVAAPNPDFPANRLHVGREVIAQNVLLLDN